jgi:hypothetical protein
MHDSADDPDKPQAAPAPARALRRSLPLDLVDVAAEIQQADHMLGTMTAGKLQVIAEQIRKLQEHARAVLQQAHVDASLHRARCAFCRRPGHVYHLYRGRDGAPYLSMLSPEDWRGAPPDPFEGSFRLEPDMSWTPVERMAERDEAEGAIRKLLHDRSPAR